MKRVKTCLALLAFTLLALPASAQDLCSFGISVDEADEYCARFGQVPSWEDCTCVSPRTARFFPSRIREAPRAPSLCDWPRDSADAICGYQGKWFDPATCRCRTFEIWHGPKIREMPRSWWRATAAGLMTWREDRLLLHRGDGSFIATGVATLDEAISLLLERADVVEIEARGLAVVDIETLQ